MEPSKTRGSRAAKEKELTDADEKELRSILRKMKRVVKLLLSYQLESDHSLEASMDIFKKASKLEDEIGKELNAYRESHHINQEEMYRSKEYQKVVEEYKKKGLDARPVDPRERENDNEVIEELTRLVKSTKNRKSPGKK